MEGKAFKLLFAIGFIFLAFILITNSFYIVSSGEQIIVERFGEKVATVKEAGFKLKIPIVDNVRRVNSEEVHTIQYGYRVSDKGTTSQGAQYSNVDDEAIILTRGSYLVNVEVMIQYKILDAADYFYNVDDQLGTLRLAFESVLRRNVQNKNLDDALLNKDVISTQVLPELNRKINGYGLGIQIRSLEIQNITVPDEVKSAYDDVNNAKNEKSELLDTAKKYRNEKLPSARAEGYKKIQNSEAYKAEKVSQAKGDVENFIQVYEKYALAKEITKTRLYLETMENVLQKVKNKYIIDSENDGVIKYLPLNPSSIAPVKEVQ